ncbi:unnamed protein product, partial [Meganyctiphanes norvegica]
DNVGAYSGITILDVSSSVGSVVKLECHTPAMDHATMVWVRMRDEQLIAIGQNKYIDDTRFQVHHTVEDSTESWNLLISSAIREDAGIYQCLSQNASYLQAPNNTPITNQLFRIRISAPVIPFPALPAFVPTTEVYSALDQ